MRGDPRTPARRYGPVHPKVKAASVGAALGAAAAEVVVWGVDELAYDGAGSPPPVPGFVVQVVYLVVPAVVALACGWLKSAAEGLDDVGKHEA